MESKTRWPNGKKAAVSFTMDNLGEAQDVYRGVWTGPHGTHPAITNQLPRMLSLLDAHGIKATYFAESWSLGVYPDVVRDMASRGHEIGWHSFQHEVWGSLSAAEEDRSFQRSFAAAKEFGVEYRGFRPPGGKINERTWALLRRRGVRYVSPEGSEAGLGRQDVVVLPFEWEAVDALYYMDKFKGGIYGETGPAKFEEYLLNRLEEVKESGGFLSVLFHPFLQTTEEKFRVLETVLKRIVKDEEIWCAPWCDVAAWIEGNRDQFARV